MYLKEIISKYRTELMGVAIWHVMLIHAYFWTGINLIDYQFSVFHSFIKLCYVQTFLFLSGFGCMSSFNKYPDIRKFYLKRIKRALIPFWIISLPFFLYEDIFKYFDVKTFFCDLTTLKFWISGNHLGMWYVSILLFCYMLTPFAYKICKFSLKWGGVWRIISHHYIIENTWITLRLLHSNSVWSRKHPLFLCRMYSCFNK